MEEFINEEEVSILTLTDENGEDADFEYIDSIEYEGKEYLVLIPVEDESGEIVILEIEPVDEETENYLSVDDEAVLNAVFGIFKENFVIKCRIINFINLAENIQNLLWSHCQFIKWFENIFFD